MGELWEYITGMPRGDETDNQVDKIDEKPWKSGIRVEYQGAQDEEANEHGLLAHASYRVGRMV